MTNKQPKVSPAAEAQGKIYLEPSLINSACLDAKEQTNYASIQPENTEQQSAPLPLFVAHKKALLLLCAAFVSSCTHFVSCCLDVFGVHLLIE